MKAQISVLESSQLSDFWTLKKDILGKYNCMPAYSSILWYAYTTHECLTVSSQKFLVMFIAWLQVTH